MSGSEPDNDDALTLAESSRHGPSVHHTVSHLRLPIHFTESPHSESAPSGQLLTQLQQSAAASLPARRGSSEPATPGSAGPHLRNLRDVHSVAAIVRPGRLFRGATPARANYDDLHLLLDDIGLLTLVDLREMKEDALQHPQRLWPHFRRAPVATLAALDTLVAAQAAEWRSRLEQQLQQAPTLDDDDVLLQFVEKVPEPQEIIAPTVEEEDVEAELELEASHEADEAAGLPHRHRHFLHRHHGDDVHQGPHNHHRQHQHQHRHRHQGQQNGDDNEEDRLLLDGEVTVDDRPVSGSAAALSAGVEKLHITDSFSTAGQSVSSPSNTSTMAVLADSTVGASKLRIKFYLPLADRSIMGKALFKTMSLARKAYLISLFLVGKILPWNSHLAKDYVLHHMNESGLLGLYILLLEYSGLHIARALRVLANRKNHPVMVHCTHGKDRTGLIIALVLRLLKVPDTVIVADYSLSDEHGNSEEGRAAFANVPQLDVDHFCRAPAYIMQDTLRYIDERWQSVEGYCDAIGFDAAWRQLLITSLTAEDAV